MVGLTYLLSSILGLLLKQLFSRRLLMLVCNCSVGNLQSLGISIIRKLQVSCLGTACAQLGLAAYFHRLVPTGGCSLHSNQTTTTTTSTSTSSFGLAWLPLPLLILFTTAYNLGLGSLTWVGLFTPYLWILKKFYFTEAGDVTAVPYCWSAASCL